MIKVKKQAALHAALQL